MVSFLRQSLLQLLQQILTGSQLEFAFYIGLKHERSQQLVDLLMLILCFKSMVGVIKEMFKFKNCLLLGTLYNIVSEQHTRYNEITSRVLLVTKIFYCKYFVGVIWSESLLSQVCDASSGKL